MKQVLLVKGSFSFLFKDIWFDMTNCKFIVKNNSFKMLVVFLPIFVADTKITFAYNFLAPLILYKKWRDFEALLTRRHLYRNIQKKLKRMENV